MTEWKNHETLHPRNHKLPEGEYPMSDELSEARKAVDTAWDAVSAAVIAARDWEYAGPWDSGSACTAYTAAQLAWRNARTAWDAAIERRGY